MPQAFNALRLDDPGVRSPFIAVDKSLAEIFFKKFDNTGI